MSFHPDRSNTPAGNSQAFQISNYGQIALQGADSLVPDPAGDILNTSLNKEGGQGLFSKFVFGQQNTDGTSGPSGAGTAVDAIAGLSKLYLGLKQFGLAKDSFKESKRQFNLNFGNQAKLTNARLTDRQNARIAAGENVQDTESYIKQFGVSGG